MNGAVLVILLLAVGGSESAKILAASPFPAISHVLPLRVIVLELAKRGHEVTYITTDPIRKPIKNLTEVDVSPAYRYLRRSVDWMAMASHEWDPVEMLWTMMDMTAPICEDGLNSPEMVDFMKSPPKFDLYIMERGLVPCFYGVAHAVGSPPVVGLVTLGAYPYIHWNDGNPDNPAYTPWWIHPYSDHLSFWQRLYSSYVWLYSNLVWSNVVLPKHETIQKNYFGPRVPSIHELERNFSLMILSNHFTQSYPRPNLPSFVEVTGLHIQPDIKPLPKDIQNWLDGATEGAIYFSLGTNVLSSKMPPEKRRAFLDAFSQLPQRVLWKWEEDDSSDLPPNVLLSKWFPQQSVLAHPNVKVFITQGGLQSFNEATYYGVPLIGIPFMGDQHYNVEKFVAAEIGYKLQFRHVTKDTVLKAIRTILENPRYRENMKKLSAVYREHQAQSMPQAIWWIEYVLRHKGAPHLRSGAMDLSWYQLLLLDVIAFVLAVAAITTLALYSLARYLTSLILNAKKHKTE
ncbi:UDP-glucosyltransferase 2-like [Schistocerca nitens]|uniref:UDP-glucosyltransferase 2-like n=1 Tax=Schistocerca nitens TaxID=7011 RepID=UPI0021184ADF|nr:UDP-glucosyltransferase 2-like [Schistocerca nitens]XP_049808734.1 UDP-glucosyltransferase 2-like [Schistocerca nitens]